MTSATPPQPEHSYSLPADEGEFPALRHLPWALALEFFAVFGLVPLIVWQTDLRSVRIATLVVLSAIGFWLLHREGALTRSFLLRWPSRRKRHRIRQALMWCALGVPVLTAIAWWLPHADLFAFPRERTGMWLVVMVAYPLISVIPQEVLFRVVVFHRYRRLFPTRVAMIAGSAIAFGWAHIIYGSFVSVVLSAIGGVVFGLTWFRTRSLLLVSLQHALFGQWIFTVGLGRYFYAGGN